MKNIQRKIRTFFIIVFLTCLVFTAFLAVLRKQQTAEYVLWIGFIFLLLAVVLVPLKDAVLALRKKL